MTQAADPLDRQTKSPAAPACAPKTEWGASGKAAAFYALVLMSLISLLGSYDRYLVGILVQSIKRDLHLSDGQIGLMSGLAFAAIYSFLTIPIARLSDGGRRVPVLTACMLLWSAMTALCGLAASFPMLLLARMGVGVGEAGCIPTTQAIIFESFPGRWRATALSIATMASGVGVTIASVAGGWLADRWGWRAAFLIGAAPGPLLSLLLWTTIPRHARPAAAPSQSDMRTAVFTLLRVRSLRLVTAGFAICTVATYALIAWIPAYLMRAFHLNAGRVGATYGLIMGVSLIIAVFVGGVIADILSRRDRRWPIWQIAITFFLAFPLTQAFLFAHSFGLALMFTAPMVLASSANSSICYAVVQDLAGPRFRATGSALFVMSFSLAGVGAGPALVGWLSDTLSKSYGDASLRYALAIASAAYLLGGLIIACATTSIAGDTASAETRGATP